MEVPLLVAASKILSWVNELIDVHIWNLAVYLFVNLAELCILDFSVDQT